MGNHPHGVGSTNGKLPNGSGLDARCTAEVAHAAYHQQLSLKEGNAIVCDLISKYEEKLVDPDYGFPYNEVYDVESAMPFPWWLDLYESTKMEFTAEYGINFVF